MKIFLMLSTLFILAINSYSQTQLQINENSLSEYKKVDVELNSIYKQLISQLTGSKGKALLIKAQKTWISFRDAHCNFTGSFYEGGSMQSSVYTNCMKFVTEERIKELKTALQERKNE